MIVRINELPANMIGFKAVGDLLKADFDVIIEELKDYINTNKNANYLLLFEKAPTDFALGAWLHEGLVRIKNSVDWSRGALVTDSERLIRYALEFDKTISGEFKSFLKSDYRAAIDWTAEKI
ncbi:SpoIIAA family protein [Flavobacterium agrisoli]|uniref:STAS/SEC14 domain-containing protein n=1 Tax=Flavobacterium agrisoli TaxID=2793066 RepID=A0A934UJX2_9FLAO|nr:STAS/SEC14 domain-containing protein [Flavobacterium agrisoli]MBK0369963.1 STAS/SEC14 domain-containing protein [Flavobacterium agrisoli]